MSPLRPDFGADGPGQGTLGRHADHQGREPLSLRGGGDTPRDRGARAPLPARRGPALDPADPRGARRAGARARGALRWLRRRAPRDRQSPPARRRASPEGDRPLRPAHDRGAADLAALRGQGGSRDRAAVGYPGAREETSMSNLAHEMLAKIEAGGGLQAAPAKTPDHSREPRPP